MAGSLASTKGPSGKRRTVLSRMRGVFRLAVFLSEAVKYDDGTPVPARCSRQQVAALFDPGPCG